MGLSRRNAQLTVTASHSIQDFSAPTVIVDRNKVEHNVMAMLQRAGAAEVRLRPHFKTHQSVEVGEWLRALGVERITVSSVAMAEGFVDAGWTDLTLALPAYPAMFARVAALLDRAQIGLIVDHPEAAEALAQSTALREAAERSGRWVPVWIKLDAGYGRAGVHWQDEDRLRAVIGALDAPWLQRMGLLAHSGHSYAARGRDQIAAVHAECLERLLPLRDRYASDFADGRCQLSVGDTPSCSVLDNFGPVDELRPGNFVFYDLSQVQIGACTREQIAASVLCPVIGKDEAHGRLILHGGAVHLSKDRIEHADGSLSFGEIAARPYDGSWQLPDPARRLTSLSQEHGIVHLPEGALADYRIGDFVQVFPVHSCLACDLHSSYREAGGVTLTRVR